MVTQLPVRPASGPTTSEDRRTETLLAELLGLADDDPRRDRLRAELVAAHLPIARAIAYRYVDRGEPFDDILQAALLGLVKAINRYDPQVGDRFLAYASPMMVGEVKRHFRDRTWAVRVPRRIQELRIAMRQARKEFTDTHRRSPTVAEIAGLLNISEDEAVEVISASDAYQSISLDAQASTEEGSAAIGDLHGDLDLAVERVADREALWPLIDGLPARERTILLLRFFGNKTQSQIAEQLGISQMHVSRLLTGTLARLRGELLRED